MHLSMQSLSTEFWLDLDWFVYQSTKIRPFSIKKCLKNSCQKAPHTCCSSNLIFLITNHFRNNWAGFLTQKILLLNSNFVEFLRLYDQGSKKKHFVADYILAKNLKSVDCASVCSKSMVMLS